MARQASCRDRSYSFPGAMKNRKMIAPTFLGPVHRRVGILDQVIGLFTVVGIDADTDTAGHGDFVSIEQEGMGHGHR